MLRRRTLDALPAAARGGSHTGHDAQSAPRHGGACPHPRVQGQLHLGAVTGERCGPVGGLGKLVPFRGVQPSTSCRTTRRAAGDDRRRSVRTAVVRGCWRGASPGARTTRAAVRPQRSAPTLPLCPAKGAAPQGGLRLMSGLRYPSRGTGFSPVRSAWGFEATAWSGARAARSGTTPGTPCTGRSRPSTVAVGTSLYYMRTPVS